MDRISIQRIKVSGAANGQFEIGAAAADGAPLVLTLSPDAAKDLARVLADALHQSKASDEIATKLPKRFAVGSARRAQLTLVRFEDDAPYALDLEMARDLAEALLAEADEVEQRTQPLRH